MLTRFYKYYYYRIDDGIKQKKPYPSSNIAAGSIKDAERKINILFSRFNNKPQNRKSKLHLHSVYLDKELTNRWRNK